MLALDDKVNDAENARKTMAITPQISSGLVAGQPARQGWLAAGIALGLAAIALCGLFWREAEGAYTVWSTSTAYNHCFLILPVAIYLAWTRRYVFSTLSPHPDWRMLLLLVPLSLMWVVAALISVLEIQQLIVLSMFQVIALAVLGWRAYRGMLLPLLYLYFLVPFGYFLVPYLQDVTAAAAIWGLRLVGIPVYSDGILIDVPAGNFVIAEACAGLRFLIASVAFGVFFAGLMYRSRVRWLIFVALSVIVPIIANCIRAWGIIAAAEWTNAAAAIEADHVIYGWGFFTAVTLLLIVVGMRFADEARDESARQPAARDTAPAPRPLSVAIAAIVGLVLAASGPAYAQLRDWRGTAGSLANAEPPPVAAPWTPIAARAIDWKPVIVGPDREFHGAFKDGGETVLRYVALYKTAGFHNNLVRGDNELADGEAWNVATTGRTQANIGGSPATVGTADIQGGGRRLLVWDFYVVNGTVVGSPTRAKLAQLRGLCGGEDTVAALVVRAAERTPDRPPEQALQDFLTAMGPPAAYLHGLQPR